MSKDDEERSPGGSVIHRHEDRPRDWQPPVSEDGAAEEVEKHFQALGFEPQTVFHELVSDLVHIDVHVSNPTPDRDFYLLFTTGMSDLPMTVPEGCEELRYAELLIGLPASWPMGEKVLTGDAPHYWPIRILKYLARFPHDNQTWLGAGHTIPNGDPPEPFDETSKLCCAMLAPPLTLPPEGHEVRIRPDKVVNLYGVLLLHESEMTLKLAKGADALYEALDRKKVSEILDPTRPPATKRGLFSIF